MWTFDAPPLDYWRRTYNFAPDQKWLDHVRLASVRLPELLGVVRLVARAGDDEPPLWARLHRASSSPPDSNYIQTGFAAGTLADEKKCAGLYVDQLQSIQDVTTRVRGAITANDARRAAGAAASRDRSRRYRTSAISRRSSRARS